MPGPQITTLSATLAALGLLALAGPAAALDTQPPGVRTEATDSMGNVYADPRGKTLYTWSADRNGVSKCNDEHVHKITGIAEVVYYAPSYQTRLTCQQIWAPFAATKDDRPVGAWTVVPRADQSLQWAYAGKPLYTFIGDAAPGEVNATGPGRNGLGRKPLMAPSTLMSGVAVKTTIGGRMLLTSSGRTLYTTKLANAAGASDTWDPLRAPALADDPRGEWSVVRRSDGGRQWAFQGKPLYVYRGDQHPGDMNGLGSPGWTTVALQAPLRPPAGFRFETSSMGPLLADSRGKTLYIFGCVDEAPDKGVCDLPQTPGADAYFAAICGVGAVCANTWRPVVAAPGARPVGRTWSLIAVDGTGARQYATPGQPNAVMAWAYKGRPLYTYAGDKAPGDANGHRVAASYYWGFGVLGDATDEGDSLFD